MTTELEALWALQGHDTQIDMLKRSLAHLPERAALHGLNERRHAADEQLAALAGQLAELNETEEQVEKELGVIEARVKQLDDMLRSPGSATRDAQAIIHEIDQLKEQAGVLEERGLELLEQRDVLVAEQTKTQGELEAVAAEAPGALAAVKTAESEAGAQLATLEAERAEAAGGVSEGLLATYERMRPKMEGVAVARVANGACTGCHLALSQADLQQLAKLAPGAHTSCEQCGRILIPA